MEETMKLIKLRRMRQKAREKIFAENPGLREAFEKWSEENPVRYSTAEEIRKQDYEYIYRCED